MKKITLILFSLGLLNLSSLAQTGWQVIYNSGNNDGLWGLQYTDINTAYVLGITTPYAFYLLKTTNSGANWIQNYNFTGFSNLNNLLFLDNNTGFISGQKNGRAIISKTTNGGVNWFDSFSIDTSGSGFYQMDFINSLTGYASGYLTYTGGPTFFYKTTNQGVSWQLRGYNNVPTGNLTFTDINNGFFSASVAIYKTTNEGASWVLKNAGQGGNLFFINGIGYSCGNNITLLKSTDSGENWFQIHQSTIQEGYLTIHFSNINTGYVGGGNFTSTPKIYKTTNGGYNWYLQNISGNYFIRDIKFVNELTGLAMGHTRYILRTTDGGGPIGITPISSEIPQQYALEQNYPNPFNPNTTIRFSIPTSSDIKITVYDLNGRMVEEIVNQFLTAGVYETNWNADKHASGIYYYCLTSDNFTETKKMVLVK